MIPAISAAAPSHHSVRAAATASVTADACASSSSARKTKCHRLGLGTRAGTRVLQPAVEIRDCENHRLRDICPAGDCGSSSVNVRRA